jgi:hypothetical protein
MVLPLVPFAFTWTIVLDSKDRSQFLPLENLSRRSARSLKPLCEIRELHMMLNPDIGVKGIYQQRFNFLRQHLTDGKADDLDCYGM